MSHFAMVPHGSPVELPENPCSQATTKDIREQLHSIYESYAIMYPNPLLSQERQERDRLQQAVTAASQATQMNPKRTKRAGLFSFLWGSRGKSEDDGPDQLAAADSEAEEHAEDGIQYMEQDGPWSEYLCGTDTLDVDCIPPEAHALARFHVASMRTRGERPNAARSSWEVAGSSVVIVTGLGEVVEFSKNGGNGRRQFTSDREHLQAFISAATDSVFHVAYVRATTIGPNLLAVSWGLPDGLVLFYRRLVGQEVIAWEPVACLSASEAVKANIGDVFLEESGSALLRVTDVCPLVFDVPNAPPNACLAVSRLGGYVELVTLPTRMWYGPEIESPSSSVRRRKGVVEHYAASLGDLAMDPASIVALTTAAYALDCICLEAFSTGVSIQTIWDRETYPDEPPAEFVLAAVGTSTKGAGEIVCFWAVSSIAPVDSGVEMLKGFSISASLVESVKLGSVGSDLTFFVDSSIMKLWRRPRQVMLKVDGQEALGPNAHAAAHRIATISVHMPIVSLCFAVESTGDALGCLLDANGGVTLINCQMLSRLVSHSLTPEQHEFLFHNEVDDDVPLASISLDRSVTSSRLLSSVRKRFVADIQFLNKQLDSKCSLLAAVVPGAGIYIVSSAVDFRDAYLKSPLHSTTLLRNSYAGIVACCNASANGACLVSTTKVSALEPRALVRSLVAGANYVEAARVAEMLADDERKDIVDAADFTYQQLWEETFSFDALINITDNQYVIDQALSMNEQLGLRLDDHDSFSLFRLVHCHALSRLICGENAQLLSRQLKGRLTALGTYELLCDCLSLSKNIANFFVGFLSADVTDIARSLARNAELDALSIVCYRHVDKLSIDYTWLNEVSPSISPMMYSHLFPVNCQATMPSFLAVTGECTWKICRWEELPAYLLDSYNLAVLVDTDDFTMLVTQLSDIVVKFEFASHDWYTKRMQEFQMYGASVQNTAELCRLGIQACSPSCDFKGELFEALQYMDGVRSATIREEETFSHLQTRPYNLLSVTEPHELVALVFEGETNVQEVDHRYRTYLIPLCETIGRENLDQALLKHCSSTFERLLSENEAPTVVDFFSAVVKCTVCAFLSRPSLEIKKRIIQNTRAFLCLIETTFAGIMKFAYRLCLDDFQSRQLIDQMWSMYECIPTRLSVDGTDDLEELHAMADEMFEALTLLSILCEWPGCHAFEIIQSAEGEGLYQKVVGCICQSFYNQRNFTEDNRAATLLSALLSDISECERVCSGQSCAVNRVFTVELVLPLLRHGKAALLRQVLDRSKSNWIEWGIVSDEIISLFNDVFKAEGDVDQAMELQSILVAHYPKSFQDLAELRRSVDAAHYINTVLLAGCGAAIFQPGDIYAKFPLDVLECVLSTNPSALICGCESWADPAWAADLNERMRNACKSDTIDSNLIDVHSLIGQAVLHLAGLMGLNNAISIMYITFRLVVHGVAAKLYGAAAALTRTLIGTCADLPVDVTTLVLVCVQEVACQSDFDDLQTKQELCNAALHLRGLDHCSDSFYQGSLDILQALTDFEYDLYFSGDLSLTVKALHTMKRFVYDTSNEYNVDLKKALVALRNQALLGFVEDSLLETISRYCFYWCIVQCSRPKPCLPTAIESVSAQSLVNAFLAYSMHMTDTDVALESLRAVRGILEEQCDAAQQSLESAPSLTSDSAIVRGLVHRGYSVTGAQRAAIAVSNVGLDAALRWAVVHSMDEDFDGPILRLRDDEAIFVDKLGCAFLSSVFDCFVKGFSGKWPSPSHIFVGPSVSVRKTIDDQIEDSSMHWDGDASSINVSCSESTEDTSNVVCRVERHIGQESTIGIPIKNQSTKGLLNGSKDLESPTKLNSVVQLVGGSQVEVSGTLHCEILAEGKSDKTFVVSTPPCDSEVSKAEPATTEVVSVNAPKEISPATPLFTAHGGNFAASLSNVSPVVNSSTARTRLLESGHKALLVARKSASPSTEERKRLIDEGRRLLQQARGNPASSSQHRYSLRSAAKAKAAYVSPAVEAKLRPACHVDGPVVRNSSLAEISEPASEGLRSAFRLFIT
ncbi:hypothetical protein MPSEU_000498500 [Mayamaea pseudoterrestris]|nr:hypothetical protein MPSEU_000498500 [Mayamaea pseudoterrestris]